MMTTNRHFVSQVSRQPSAGFTLLELVVALALLSVVLLATYGSITQSARIQDAVRQRGETIRAAASFIERLERELGTAYVDYAVATTEGTLEIESRTRFLGLDIDGPVPRDGLLLSCQCGEVWTHGLDDSDRIPHTEVAYDFIYDSDEELTLLMRREDATIDNDATYGGIQDPLWEVIRGVNYRFFDATDKTWKDSWDSLTATQELPVAVEVTLWLAPAVADEFEIDKPLVLGTTILLPHAVSTLGNET